jgi:hypothetical protein
MESKAWFGTAVYLIKCTNKTYVLLPNNFMVQYLPRKVNGKNHMGPDHLGGLGVDGMGLSEVMCEGKTT